MKKLVEDLLLSTSKQHRVAAEIAFNGYLVSSPSALLQLIQLIESARDDVKLMIITQVRRVLLSQNYIFWRNLTNQVRDASLKLLLNLVMITPMKIRLLLAQIVGQLTLQIFSNNLHDQSIKLTMQALLSSSSVDDMIVGLKLLQEMFGRDTWNYVLNSQDVLSLFKNSFSGSNNMHIQIASGKTLLAFVLAQQFKNLKVIEPLMIKLIQSCFNHLKHNDQNLLKCLVDLIDHQPKLLKAYADQLIALSRAVIGGSFMIGVKRMVIEMLTTFAESMPSCFEGKANRIEEVYHIILLFMMQISSSLNQQYLNPREGYSDYEQSDQDYQITKLGMDCINRVVQSLINQGSAQIAEQALSKLIFDSDWKLAYSAIMAFSQVGQHINNHKLIVQIVKKCIVYSQNPNAKLRYAFCHLVGQLSSDCQGALQKNSFGELLIPLARLIQDPTGRVRAHSINALINFIEQISPDGLSKILQDLIGKSLQIIKSDISFVKESAVNLLGILGYGSKRLFLPYLQIVMKALFDVFQNFKGRNYISLKSQCIQAITYMSQQIPKDSFKPYIQRTVQYMILGQDQFEQVSSALSFIVNGWKRLCKQFPIELSKWIKELLPNLFRIIKQNIQEEASDNDLSEAINLISCYAQNLKQLFSDGVQQSCKLIQQCLNLNNYNKTKEECLRAIPNLVSACYPEVQIPLVKDYIKKIIKMIEKQTCRSMLIQQIIAISQCLEFRSSQFIAEQDIPFLYNLGLKVIRAGLIQKTVLKKSRNEDSERQEIQSIIQQLHSQNKLIHSVCVFLSRLIKTHQKALYIIKPIIQEIIPLLCQDQEFLPHLAVAQLSCTICEIYPPQLKTYYVQLIGLLIHCVQGSDCKQTKQCAFYSIGVLFAKLSNQQAKSVISKTIECLKMQLGSRYMQANKHVYAKENCVSALGKIIRYHSSLISDLSLGQLWMQRLPLYNDKEEAKVQHQIFLQVLQTYIGVFNPVMLKQSLLAVRRILLKPKVALGQTMQGLKRIIARARQSQSFAGIWECCKQKESLLLAQTLSGSLQ